MGGILFFLALSLFVFPVFSPIPYFPSNKKDTNLIMRSLGIKNNQIIFDLGAGDGWVVFEAAKRAYERKRNTQFVAVEINPLLVIVLYVKRLFHKNRKNITVVRGNIFNLPITKLLPKVKTEIVYYLYISPWYLERVSTHLKKYRPNFYIISYMYAIPHQKEMLKLKGKHSIFKYKYV